MIKERADQARLSKTNPNSCYYVYIHRRVSDGKPFYVGKGKSRRAWDKSGRSSQWVNVASKHGYNVEIVFDNLEEHEAFQCEIDTIIEFRYFGYNLCNHTEGGEGLSGFKWSEEQMKNHVRTKNLGRKHSAEVIEKRRKALLGHVTSEETKIKIRDAQIDRSVISHMVKYLLGKKIISIQKRAEILKIDPKSLCKKPESYKGFSREQVMKSADARRGKLSWNSGLKSPNTAGALNNSADNTVYVFRRILDGLIFTGNRYDLANAFNLNISALGKLFYTKPGKSSQGWELLKETNGTA